MSDSIGQIARNGLAIGFLSKNACPRSVATYAFVVYPDVVEAAIDARVEGLKKSRRGMVGQKAPLASGCHVVEDSTTDARKPCSVRRLAWLAATRGSQGTKASIRAASGDGLWFSYSEVAGPRHRTARNAHNSLRLQRGTSALKVI